MQMLRTQVRIPVELADWLKQQAKEHHRSMNGELVEKLLQLKKKAS
ncbi:Arc family DNA-binding protein [Metapseudomonas furukawaii]